MFFTIIYKEGQKLLKLLALERDKVKTKSESKVYTKREILWRVCRPMFPHVINIEDLLQCIEPIDTL